MVPILLMYHYVFKKKIISKLFLPPLIVSAFYLFLRSATMQKFFFGAEVTIKRIPGFFAALTGYCKILLFPVNLHMEYGNMFFSFSDWRVLAGLAMFLFLLLLAFKKRNSRGLVTFAILWFFIVLLPTTSIYPIHSFYMAEHWLYLSFVGFFIILGRMFTYLYEKEKTRFVGLGLFICLLFSYSYLTIRQNIYWKSEIPFYKRTLEYSPRSVMAHNNLGGCYFKLGNKDMAIKEYLMALKINPNFVEAYCNLGKLYYDAGNVKQGLQMYLEAIRVDPGRVEAYNNIADIYISLGKNEEGVKYYQIALSINPQMPAVCYSLGNAYYNLGQKDRAMEMIRQSIKLDPFYLEAYNNLAAGYAEKGKIKEAIELWNKCLEIDPDFITAHFNLAVFYFSNKDYTLSIKHCDRVGALGGIVDPVFLKKLEPFRKTVDSS
jgi:tetratricopeptide (TPR) repeat protein